MAESSISRISRCESCKRRKQNPFCNLPPEALIELDRIKQTRTFAAGERLFEEGEPVGHVLIVCSGKATLTLQSSVGNAATLGLSEHGEVLGLSAVLSGGAHQTSAEALETTRVAAIGRSDFLIFLQRFPTAAMNAGAELSRKVNRAYDKIRIAGCGLSVRQRLAAWLLQLKETQSGCGEPLTVALTHERIAQLLGASRESVTRALSSFKKSGVIELRGVHLHIRDYKYLRSLLHLPAQDTAQCRLGDERHRQGAVMPLS